MYVILRTLSSSKSITSLILYLLIFGTSYPQGIKLDSGFNQTGIVQIQHNDIYNSPTFQMDGAASALQPNGKLVFGVYKIDSIQFLRFNVNGSPDSSFGKNGMVSKYEAGYSVQPIKITVGASGKIVVLLNQNGDTSKYQMACYYPNGKTDSSFGINGKLLLNFPTPSHYFETIKTQPDGKILLAGAKQNDLRDWGGFCTIRLNIDGSTDSSFGNSGTVFTQFNYVPTVLDDGQIYGGGAIIKELLIQPDGKIIAAGTTGIALNGELLSDSLVIVRYKPNGSLDSSFNSNGKFIYDIPNSQNPYRSGTIANSACLQADGKIVVSGGSYQNQTHGQWQQATNVVARILPNGRLDSSFNNDGVFIMSPTGNYSLNLKTFIQADGKIVIAGNSSNSGPFVGVFYFMYINRLNVDGSLDTSFYLNMPLIENQRSNTATNFFMGGRRIYAVGEIPINEGYPFLDGVYAFKNDGTINNPTSLSICHLASNIYIPSDIEGNSYQWQVSADSIHFSDISNGNYYSGVNSSVLSISNFSTALNGYQYRCVTEKSISNITTIHFLKDNEVEWTGNVSNVWEEAGNWLCGSVPGSNDEVIINYGSNITINSTVIVNSLILQPGASLNIQKGVTLKITKSNFN